MSCTSSLVTFQVSNKRYCNSLALKLKRLLGNYRSESYANHTSTLTYNNSSLWKTTRKLLSIHNQLSTFLYDDGIWAIPDQDKANIFTKNLENTFQLHHNILHQRKSKKLKVSLTLHYKCAFFFPEHSLVAKSILILKTPPKKIPGL